MPELNYELPLQGNTETNHVTSGLYAGQQDRASGVGTASGPRRSICPNHRHPALTLRPATYSGGFSDDAQLNVRLWHKADHHRTGPCLFLGIMRTRRGPVVNWYLSGRQCQFKDS